jgi:hypothetical protein
MLFKHTMLHFELWLLLGLAQHVTPATATRQMLNTAMAALACVAEEAAALAVDPEYGLDVSPVEAACVWVRQQLENAMAERQLQAAAEWKLPAVGFGAAAAAADSGGSWVLPKGVVPEQLAVGAEQQGLDAAKQRALRNLGSLPCVDADLSLHDALQQLLQLLQLCSDPSTASASRDVAMQHGLRAAEAVFFGRLAPALATVAAQDTSSSYSIRAAAMAAAGLDGISEGDSQLLVEVVDAYRLLLQVFRASAAAASAMAAELRSRELLVAWTAYCVLYEVSRHCPHLLDGSQLNTLNCYASLAALAGVHCSCCSSHTVATCSMQHMPAALMQNVMALHLA